jgi:uncharacterized damage-inducible protein DinB
VILKTAGLDDETLRRPIVQSGTSLLWLVKHLTRVEIGWFQSTFAGRDVEISSDSLSEDDTAASLVLSYRDAIASSNEIVDASDLEQLCAGAGTAPEPMTLRWVLVHMVEETARHAGHADILREQIDGQTGR